MALLVPHTPLQLLDVLEHVPEVFGAHIWPHLPREACGSLKLACTQTQQAVDLFTTSVAAGQSCVAEAKATQSASARRRSWSRAVLHLPQFLARLPRLTALTLRGWPCQAELATTLRQCGRAAAPARVTQLTLCGGWLTAAVLCAVPLAFPGLVELRLEDPNATGSKTGGPDPSLEPQGQLFLPLLSALHLTKVEVVLTFTQLLRHYNAPTSRPFFSSLGGLSHLRHLRLQLHSVDDPQDLLLLSDLTQLRHVALTFFDATLSVVDVSALFSPALTSLHLRDVNSAGVIGGGGSSDDEDAQVSHPPAAVAAALSRLGALSGLQSLRLSVDFVVDDAVFAAIRRLSQLTELQVGAFALTAPPAPGHLPLLQWLNLGGSSDDAFFLPSRLLQALQPFLPLPSLTTLNEGALRLDLCDDPRGRVAQRLELKVLVRHLAAAPRLRLPAGVELIASPDRAPLSLARAALVLHPLPHLCRHVSLVRVACMEPQWGALMRGLPGVTSLDLSNCELRGLHLTCALRHLKALHTLSVTDCWVEEGAWEELAGECRRPLVVQVMPRVSWKVEGRCWDVQQDVFCEELMCFEGNDILRDVDSDDRSDEEK